MFTREDFKEAQRKFPNNFDPIESTLSEFVFRQKFGPRFVNVQFPPVGPTGSTGMLLLQVKIDRTVSHGPKMISKIECPFTEAGEVLDLLTAHVRFVKEQYFGEIVDA